MYYLIAFYQRIVELWCRAKNFPNDHRTYHIKIPKWPSAPINRRILNMWNSLLHNIKSVYLILIKIIVIKVIKNHLVTLKRWFWWFQSDIINPPCLCLSYYNLFFAVVVFSSMFIFDVFDGVINICFISILMPWFCLQFVIAVFPYISN